MELCTDEFNYFPDLNSGEISIYNLWTRLSNQSISPMEREIINAVLNIFNSNQGGNASGTSPNMMIQKQPMAALFQQQQPPIPPPIQVSPMQQQQMKSNSLNIQPAPIPIPPASALSPLPPPNQGGDFNQHLLFQHQANAKQLRVSPLPPGDYSSKLVNSIDFLFAGHV